MEKKKKTEPLWEVIKEYGWIILILGIGVVAFLVLISPPAEVVPDVRSDCLERGFVWDDDRCMTWGAYHDYKLKTDPCYAATQSNVLLTEAQVDEACGEPPQIQVAEETDVVWDSCVVLGVGTIYDDNGNAYSYNNCDYERAELVEVDGVDWEIMYFDYYERVFAYSKEYSTGVGITIEEAMKHAIRRYEMETGRSKKHQDWRTAREKELEAMKDE